MIVLGIDPGSRICGYGVVSLAGNDFTLVEYGTIEFKTRSNKQAINDFNERLKEIYTRLCTVIKRTRPDYACFESLFYHKNAQSLIKLAHARSAAVLSALVNDIPVAEYSPREIKKALTGRGNASKEQVQFMTLRTLGIQEKPDCFDASDALATAVCHAVRVNSIFIAKQTTNKPSTTRSNNSWKDFVENNPHRIIK